MYLSFYFQIHTERNMNFPNSVPNSMPNSHQIVLILANSDLELGSRSRAKSTLDDCFDGQFVLENVNIVS